MCTHLVEKYTLIIWLIGIRHKVLVRPKTRVCALDGIAYTAPGNKHRVLDRPKTRVGALFLQRVRHPFL